MVLLSLLKGLKGDMMNKKELLKMKLKILKDIVENKDRSREILSDEQKKHPEIESPKYKQSKTK